MDKAYLGGHAAGRIENRAAFTLRVLEKRGIPVPDDIRERITSCTDFDTRTLWFDRSLTASTAEDLFIESPEAPQSQADRAGRT